MARTHDGLVALGVAALFVAGATGLSPVSAKAGPILAVAPATIPGSVTSNPVAFGVPTVVDPIHTNGEPDLAINPKNGSVFNSGPTGTGTQRSTWFGSVDQGQTFRTVNQLTPPNSIVSLPAPQPGGGDTDINFDRSGKQYFADLYALTCLRVATTTDNGATTNQNVYPGGCSGVPGADRQWLAVYDPATRTPVSQGGSAYTTAGPLTYMEYNNLGAGTGAGSSQWTKSTDGLTYSTASTPGVFGADGYPAIDQVTGKVFETAGATPADGAAQLAACPVPTKHCLLLNIGTPDSAGNLHFRDDPMGGGLIHVADVPGGGPDSLFTVASMDSARNLYVTYAVTPDDATKPGLRQVFVTASSPTSGWTQWSTPVQVSGLLPNDKVDVFPWGKAGGPGRMDAVWYGSDKLEDPSSHSSPPKAWNVFMSQAIFQTFSNGTVNISAAPQIIPAQATPHPMHYDDICLQGTACIASAGNRNLADFFVVTLDAKGAAQIVYDDTSNGLIQTPQTCSVATGVQTQVLDHCGAGVISVAHQSAGPSALDGTDVAATFTGTTSPPITGLTRTSGKALYPVIGGTNVPSMDLTATHLSLVGNTLTVTTDVAGDPRHAVTDLLAKGDAGTLFAHYVTRWQLGNTIYYGAMQVNATGNTEFYAGKAQSVDLCSVSACFPHVITYPEPETASTNPGSGFTEPGTLTCAVGTSGPCQITISINVAHVGGPTASSFIEEVGGYALSSSHQQGATTTANAQADNVSLEIDGICCFNYGVVPAVGQVPESPLAAFFPLAGVALITVGAVRRRRRRRKALKA